MTRLEQLRDWLPGARLVGDGRVAFSRVHTDSRTLQPGDLFVALRGERFDAHDFLGQAARDGAVAAIAERGLAQAGLPGLEVEDSLLALQAFAGAWRARWTGSLLAVTGSNGKTTVTQMIGAILEAAAGDRAFATQGNLNNHIGVPLMLLRLRERHRLAVLELGMNHPGEIGLLAGLAAPRVALVNNAQREHQEFMAGVEAVAIENGAAIEALPPDGIAVFPADDAQAAVWQRQAAGRRRLRFAEAGPAADRAEVQVHGHPHPEGHWQAVLETPLGRLDLVLQAPGRHNLRNAAAAAAAAVAAGLPLEAIASGLQRFRPVRGRSQVGSLDLDGRRRVLVDDSYNANPDSVLAAIEVLAGLPGPRWLILGDMGEVGEHGPQFHAEVGARARERGIEHLWCVGTLGAHAAQAFGAAACALPDTAAAVARVEAAAPLPDASALLVKGSRFMRMEQVVQALQRRAGRREGGAA